MFGELLDSAAMKLIRGPLVYYVSNIILQKTYLIHFFFLIFQETIIVQIEKEGEAQVLQQQQNVLVKKDRKSPKKNNDKFDLSALERTLCSSKDKDFSSNFVCDICDNSYGCLKCLKSHYESVHVTQLRIVQFKCDNSPNCPKGLYCPVCGMVFNDRYVQVMIILLGWIYIV